MAGSHEGDTKVLEIDGLQGLSFEIRICTSSEAVPSGVCEDNQVCARGEGEGNEVITWSVEYRRELHV